MATANIQQRSIKIFPCKQNRDPVDIRMGKWTPTDGFIQCENFDRFKFMYPQYNYHMTIEDADRFHKEDGALIRLYLKNYDGIQQIEKLVCTCDDQKKTFSESFVELDIKGHAQQELSVLLDVHFSDGVIINHHFKIWYFPISEYQSRDLDAKASRIVAEKSTIPFQSPTTVSPIKDWLKLTTQQQFLLDDLYAQIKDMIGGNEQTTVDRAKVILRGLNQNVRKGYSTIHPDSMGPTQIIAAAKEKPLTHFCFNFLTTTIFCSIGIPARMIIKRGVHLGENFGLEGDGYAMEYFDEEKNRLVLCSPWLNIVHIDAANNYSLDLYDFMQLVRMNQANQLILHVYDSNLDRFSEYRSDTTSKYEIGFENHYAIGFLDAIEHLHHNIKTGDLEFWPIESLLKKYYPEKAEAGSIC